jgi:hypothetical protein
MFVARGVAGEESAVPRAYGPDAATGRRYDCDPANPKVHFRDVAPSEVFCRHVHFLWAKNAIPDSPDTFSGAREITRGEMEAMVKSAFAVRKANQ